MAAIENWTDNGDGTHTLDEKFEYHDGHQLAVMPIGIRRKEAEARRLEALRPKPKEAPKAVEPTTPPGTVKPLAKA